ncbi:MAG: Gldg family protein [Bacteroidota bacterium]
MKHLRIILAKELRSSFDTSLAYIFIIFFLLLSGAYVATNLFLENTASMRVFFDVAPLLLVLFAPAVTMRMLAEEKRVGTFEIIHTKPVTVPQIVLAKFFAAWIMVCFALAPTIIYALALGSLGSLDGGALAGGYLGLFLLGGVFAAAGLFGSSLTDNQIVALILGFVICFVLFMLDKVLMYVPLSMVSTVEYLGVGHHFGSLARGVIDSRAAVYFVSLIVLFLMLAALNAAQEPGQTLLRWRDFRIGSRFGRIALASGILLFVNLIAARSFLRVDATTSGAYTLSETSRILAAHLEDNLLVRVYFSPDLPPPYHHHRRSTRDLLEEYRALSGGRFHYRFIDPLGSPAAEQEAVEQGIAPIQVKVIKDNRFQNARAFAGMTMSYGDRQETLPVVTDLDRLEYEITGSMKKMLTAQPRSVGMVEGLGGPGRGEMKEFLAALSRQHAVTFVDFSRPAPIPAEYAALLLVGPEGELTETQRYLLDQYIMRGGRMGFFMNNALPGAEPGGKGVQHGLDPMFDSYGWILKKEVVADARCAPLTVESSLGGVTYTSEVLYPFHPIAADFDRTDPLVMNLTAVRFPVVSPLDTRLAGIRGVSLRVLAVSSGQARRIPADSVDLNPSRAPAPSEYTEASLPLAAALEGSFRSLYADNRDPAVREIGTRTGVLLQPRSPLTRLAVVGDGDFVLDDYQEGYDNLSFAVNIVDWLVNDTTLTAIRARDLSPSALREVPEATKSFIKYVTFTGPPALIMLLGVFWMGGKAMRRRRHKNSY